MALPGGHPLSARELLFLSASGSMTTLTRKRPLSVTIIGCLFVAVGVIALALDVTGSDVRHPFESDVAWAAATHVLAILIGVFMLRGSNWARWLALLWMGGHVILSAFHQLQELVIHAVLFALLVYLLLRPAAREYFQGAVRK